MRTVHQIGKELCDSVMLAPAVLLELNKGRAMSVLTVQAYVRFSWLTKEHRHMQKYKKAGMYYYMYGQVATAHASPATPSPKERTCVVAARDREEYWQGTPSVATWEAAQQQPPINLLSKPHFGKPLRLPPHETRFGGVLLQDFGL